MTKDGGQSSRRSPLATSVLRLSSSVKNTMETILTSLTLGLLATTSPCVLPLYPGFLAYISGGQEGLQGKWQRYLLGFFVLAGVLTMMLALGGLIALLSISVGRALSVIIPIADAIIIFLGILLDPEHQPLQKPAANPGPGLIQPVCQRFSLRTALRADCPALLRAAGGQHLCPFADGR